MLLAFGLSFAGLIVGSTIVLVIGKSKSTWFCDVSREAQDGIGDGGLTRMYGLGHDGDKGQNLVDSDPARVPVLGHRGVDVHSCCW